MKDEIKEILDKFDKVLENYELDKKWGQMSVDSICHLFPNEMIIIKDNITNLQEELEEEKRIEQASLDTINNLQEENKMLKKTKNYANDEVVSYCNTTIDLQQRIDKAVEYIVNNCGFQEIIISDGDNDKIIKIKDLVNILQGSDKNE